MPYATPRQTQAAHRCNETAKYSLWIPSTKFGITSQSEWHNDDLSERILGNKVFVGARNQRKLKMEILPGRM